MFCDIYMICESFILSILSVAATTAAATTVAATTATTTVIDKYICKEGKSQYGYDIAHTKEASRENCAKRCEESDNKQCIGFDYDINSKDCWLSATPQSKVGLTNHNGRWACEKRGE